MGPQIGFRSYFGGPNLDASLLFGSFSCPAAAPAASELRARRSRHHLFLAFELARPHRGVLGALRFGSLPSGEFSGGFCKPPGVTSAPPPGAGRNVSYSYCKTWLFSQHDYISLNQKIKIQTLGHAITFSKSSLFLELAGA